MLHLLAPILFGICAAQASDYHSPKTASLAGAGHALPILSDQVYLNPAATSHTKTYNIHMGFNTYHGPNDSEPKGRIYNVTLLDGRNEVFQAGLGFTKRANGNLVHLGASKSFIEKMGFGFGTKYAWNAVGRPKAKDVSLSYLYEAVEGGAVSFIADNLLSDPEGEAWGWRREFTLGLKYSLRDLLTFFVDPHVAPDLPGSGFGYEVGAELQIMQDLMLRIGKSKQSFQPHLERFGRGYGWGAGWTAPKISLDFAMYRSLEPMMTTHTVFSGTILY